MGTSFNFETLEERYLKQMAKTITVSVEDLTDNERTLIRESFDLFEAKLEEIKTLQDEVKRLSIELANKKAMHEDAYKPRRKDDYDDSTYDSHDLDYK
jgi:phage host-nuclease inhibitor protein Gam